MSADDRNTIEQIARAILKQPSELTLVQNGLAQQLLLLAIRSSDDVTMAAAHGLIDAAIRELEAFHAKFPTDTKQPQQLNSA